MYVAIGFLFLNTVSSMLNFYLSLFFISPTRETIEQYKQSFGDDYFSFWVGGVCYLVLNSQFYQDPSNVQDFYAGTCIISYKYNSFQMYGTVPVLKRLYPL
jgi:hypothetical protein